MTLGPRPSGRRKDIPIRNPVFYLGDGTETYGDLITNHERYSLYQMSWTEVLASEMSMTIAEYKVPDNFMTLIEPKDLGLSDHESLSKHLHPLPRAPELRYIAPKDYIKIRNFTLPAFSEGLINLFTNPHKTEDIMKVFNRQHERVHSILDGYRLSPLERREEVPRIIHRILNDIHLTNSMFVTRDGFRSPIKLFDKYGVVQRNDKVLTIRMVLD